MADEPKKTTDERLLDTLVANTEALTNLTAVVSNHDREYAEGVTAARQDSNGLSAKLENLDRSVGEMKLATEQGETARQAELKRIYDLLDQERTDRRDAVTDGREGERTVQKSERELLRDMLREELGERRETRQDNRNLVKTAGAEVWKAGGKYIVAAVVILILAWVMQATDMTLADVIGLSRK